jgi:hypothetical protein
MVFTILAMALPSPSTTTGSPPADHDLASLNNGPLDDNDTGTNPIIDDKEVQEEGQYSLQASLDTGLPVDNNTRFNSLIDPKKVQEEVQDVVRASLDACLHVDDDAGFNSIINDNKVLHEAQDAVQPQRNLATLPSTHSITPCSQLADHGPSTLDDALPVDEDAGFNSIVLHDKIDKDVRQGVVQLDVTMLTFTMQWIFFPVLSFQVLYHMIIAFFAGLERQYQTYKVAGHAKQWVKM